MAVKTVASGGGNFNSGATWVGGVAPVTNDSIVADATSGNLTINASTVTLTGANFTGYTGTLTFSSGGAMNFAASSTLTLSSGMTIPVPTSGTTGFQLNSTLTIVSPVGGKAIPIISATNYTVTLVNDLWISYMPSSSFNIRTSFSGANVVITMTSLSGGIGWVVPSPYKIYFRPSGAVTWTGLSTSGVLFPVGYFVFDTTQTINLSSSLRIDIGSTNQGTTIQNQTLEFAQSTTFTGSGAVNGAIMLDIIPYPLLNSSATYSIVNTAGQSIYSLRIQQSTLSNNSAIFNFPVKLNLSYMTLQSLNVNTGTQSFIFTGSGGFSTSYWTITTPPYTVLNTSGSPLVNLLGNPTFSSFFNVALSGDATYSVGTMSIYGSNLTNRSRFSSMTASTPADIYIDNGAYGYIDIVDINNTGPIQYALTNNGNTLTRTTGFVGTISSGGGGSFTYVN